MTMGLSVMCSLALMLLLFASVLHWICLPLAAWVQFGVFVPYAMTQKVIGGGGEGSEADGNVTKMPLVSFVDDRGPMIFVSVRLGLWNWCDQLRQVSPNCEEPGFVGGVEVIGLVALFTLPLAFFLLCYSACLQRQCQRRRLFTRHACVVSACSGVLLLVALVIYGVLARREIKTMLKQIGERGGLPTILGWGFGAEGVAGVLACVAAVCLVLHLRTSPKGETEFELVV